MFQQALEAVSKQSLVRTRTYRFGHAIQAGRNHYHVHPDHAAFGGYKESGIVRKNHKMMLDHAPRRIVLAPQ
jgi:hypothetical protein